MSLNVIVFPVKNLSTSLHIITTFELQSLDELLKARINRQKLSSLNLAKAAFTLHFNSAVIAEYCVSTAIALAWMSIHSNDRETNSTLDQFYKCLCYLLDVIIVPLELTHRSLDIVPID